MNFCLNNMTSSTGMPNNEEMMFAGSWNFSERAEKIFITKMPSSIFSIHWCQSWAGFHIILQKCGTITPMNSTGPKNAVTDAESREDAMITRILSR